MKGVKGMKGFPIVPHARVRAHREFTKPFTPCTAFTSAIHP